MRRRPPGTSSGTGAEGDLVDRLSARRGVPAVSSCAAAAAALRRHDIGQLQLVHPPWLDDDFDVLGPAYFRALGLGAVVTGGTGIPDSPDRVGPRDVLAWFEREVRETAEANFLAGTGFRAAGAVQERERRTGRLVLQANQALLRAILTATGSRLRDHGLRSTAAEGAPAASLATPTRLTPPRCPRGGRSPAVRHDRAVVLSAA